MEQICHRQDVKKVDTPKVQKCIFIIHSLGPAVRWGRRLTITITITITAAAYSSIVSREGRGKTEEGRGKREEGRGKEFNLDNVTYTSHLLI